MRNSPTSVFALFITVTAHAQSTVNDLYADDASINDLYTSSASVNDTYAGEITQSSPEGYQTNLRFQFGPVPGLTNPVEANQFADNVTAVQTALRSAHSLVVFEPEGESAPIPAAISQKFQIERRSIPTSLLTRAKNIVFKQGNLVRESYEAPTRSDWNVGLAFGAAYGGATAVTAYLAYHVSVPVALILGVTKFTISLSLTALNQTINNYSGRNLDMQATGWKAVKNAGIFTARQAPWDLAFAVLYNAVARGTGNGNAYLQMFADRSIGILISGAFAYQKSLVFGEDKYLNRPYTRLTGILLMFPRIYEEIGHLPIITQVLFYKVRMSLLATLAVYAPAAVTNHLAKDWVKSKLVWMYKAFARKEYDRVSAESIGSTYCEAALTGTPLLEVTK